MPTVNEQAIQSEIATILDQIITLDQLRALYPYPDGRLLAKNSVQKWLYDPDILGKYAFRVGNTPCILKQHLEGWQPPFKRAHKNSLAAQFVAQQIGASIRATRQSIGESMVDVARAAGISFNYLGDIEKGRT